jgi:hypothetical protein
MNPLAKGNSMRIIATLALAVCSTFSLAQATVLQVDNNGTAVAQQAGFGHLNLLSGCSATFTSAFNITCLPTALAYLDQTGVSTANSGSAQNILASTPAAGQYKVSVYADQSAGCTTVSTGALTVVLGWTDATHARVGATLTLTPGTADTGTGSFVSQTEHIWAAANSAITVTDTYVACSSGTWTYDQHASVVRVE